MDDDLDSGSIKPFQLFLIFHELVSSVRKDQKPAYMIDQSHNVSDPIEALMTSAEEIHRAFVQALLVDRARLAASQEHNDAVMALKTLKQAFTTDVSPILQMARYDKGCAIDPVDTYRQSTYRAHKADERPQGTSGGQTGIV
jgi:L-rhamnose isomerase/sugar isomerase